MPAQTRTAAPKFDAAKLTTRATAKPRFTIDSRATRAAVGDGTHAAVGVVTTGTYAGEETLVHINGTNMQGMPLAVVLCAIRDGAIPRGAIDAILAASE